MLVSSKTVTGGIAGPVVTICARNNVTKDGWRVAPPGNIPDPLLEDHCTDEERIKECINEKTYQREDTVLRAELGYDRKQVQELTEWSVDFTFMWYGRCFSVVVPRAIGPNYQTDMLILHLNRTNIYEIYVHDGKYFIVNDNDFGVPNLYIRVDPEFQPNFYYQFSLTRFHELNIPEAPCEEEPGYRFQTCVKEHLSNKVAVFNVQ
jgi:hypothetical protein